MPRRASHLSKFQHHLGADQTDQQTKLFRLRRCRPSVNLSSGRETVETLSSGAPVERGSRPSNEGLLQTPVRPSGRRKELSRLDRYLGDLVRNSERDSVVWCLIVVEVFDRVGFSL